MTDRVIISGEWHVVETCYTCNVRHSFPDHIYQAAIQRRGEMSIYCPNGHAWVYKSHQKQAEEDKLRIERDRLKQQLAEKDDEIKRQRDWKEEERRRVIALRGVITKTKKRVSAGVCPCCNRTFQNLAQHMANKHSDYQSHEEVA